MAKQTGRTYYQQYLQSWCRLGRLWAGLAILGAAALFSCQLWLWQSSRADAWYGQDYVQPLPAAQPAWGQTAGLWGSITLELEKYTQLEQAYVLINGSRADSFTENSLTLLVCEGDWLELDCTAYSRPVSFRLAKASAGIDRSRLQQELRLQGERAPIGRIAFQYQLN